MPKRFMIREHVPNVLVRALHRLGLGGLPPTVVALQARDHDQFGQTSKTSESLKLGTNNWTKQTRYRFDDELGHFSTYLFITRVKQIVNVGGVVDAQIDAGAPGVPLKVRMGATSAREFTVSGCSDPTLQCELMLPWLNEPPLDLRLHVGNYVRDRVGPEGARLSLDDVFDRFFPRERPDGAELWIDRREPFALAEGASETFHVNVHLGRPGRAAYAVRVTDRDHPEDFVVSDIIEVEAVD